MSLRFKAVVIFCGTIFILLAIVGVTLSQFIQTRFEIVEKENISLNMKRVQEVYALELQHLSQKLSDWSNWDDTYKFAVDKNTTYIASNFSDQTFLNLAINLIVIVSPGGDIIYGEEFTQNDIRIVDVPSGFREVLRTFPMLYQHDTETSEQIGLVELPSGIMLIASRPLVKSDGSGSMRGSVIFGKYLGKRLQDQFAKTAHLSLEFFPTSQPLSSHIRDIFSQFTSETSIVVHNHTSEQIGAHILLYDLDKKPIVVVTGVQRRDIFLQAQESIRWLFIFLLGIGAITTMVSLGFLQYQIFSPVQKLIGDVILLGRQNDAHFRLTKSRGTDEFFLLRQSINQMLDRLQGMQEDLASEEKKFMTYLDVANTMFLFVDTNGIIKIANKKTCDIFGLSSDKIIGHPIAEFIIDEGKDKQKNTLTSELAFTDTPAYIENTIHSSDHGDRLIAWHTAVFIDDKSVVRGIIYSGDDITKPRQQQLEKQKQWDQIEAQNNELVNTKRAVLNLLEDAKDLEEELKNEKLNVEKKVIERTKQLQENIEALRIAKKQISEGWMELQLEKARLTSSINSLSHGLLITDREQRIIMMNAKAKEIFGMTSDVTHIREINDNLKGVCDLFSAVVEA